MPAIKRPSAARSRFWAWSPKASTTRSKTSSRCCTARAAIFMVPETERTTWFHVFIGTRLEDRRLRWIGPLVKKAAVALAWLEIRDDARFIPTVADTPEDMKGMRLGKYDKPLVHNHKLLRQIYWGDDAQLHTLDDRRRV